MNPSQFNRRQFLTRSANGFGLLALTALLADDQSVVAADRDPLSVKPTHFPAKAKSVIFLFMDGGPSQVDTFDPKPRLTRDHGKAFTGKIEPTQFNNIGKIYGSPWKFRKYGESGIPISDLFPNIATCADDLAVIRSMVSNFSEHTNANYFIHTGHGQQGRPSMGAWTTYGLGSESKNFPGFIVIGSGMIPPGGMDCFNNGFLPASYQGSLFKNGPLPVADLRPANQSAAASEQKRKLLRRLDQSILSQLGNPDPLESAVQNYELAFRMQTAVPELMDIKSESQKTQELYGLDESRTSLFGRQCLIARRLVERGVRFIELLCPNLGFDRWDQHNQLKAGHEANAAAVDKPIAGLLKDLKSRGLLDSTLVVWAGEFGRTPMAQGSDGRDHNPFGFSIWMAGGGIQGGTIHGETDEFGYHAIANKVEIHDLHATMLHLLGLDHTKTTYRFGGRDMRLTDVFGEVVHPIIRS
ncbi:DUF1501 domain-containing protein [Tuwongella immobilis]|uniref:Sulfatase n=1 Tax=Tuwongella immobilis TaxID=692036 RepID=A0A6C2YP13_9BACT|nr:DUF1501 domain-containing protein [Tuwongella immobilis]VIP03107.1 sulfatase : Uncharacterized protein OS=Singulisphaera acidiphila (strain ATCC BAA-1392 / DSM 18658 / VKM B-2454 / MOB10) GN=Sinac_1211 PE=4 SV=1: DUF1501 [Tuwongella immobilis]VTS03409.1 sulfatase : Uncharacterized protein OS=Singulisphaera acidiphila (strain ATCC BAA-1392 / DSM 18658 / VKM B-2454 / MOB10) GN=Sinac_1211 PE=4 SV=1: DUF1501 [Tuwongella immobilis]